MNSKVVIAFATVVVLSTVQSISPPVFLQGDSKICTLNTVGVIPNGNVKYPVYQKVCRQVIPTLGDPISEEDEGTRKANPKALKDEAASSEKVRRAIMAQQIWDEGELDDEEEMNDEVEVKA